MAVIDTSDVFNYAQKNAKISFLLFILVNNENRLEIFKEICWYVYFTTLILLHKIHKLCKIFIDNLETIINFFFF